MQDWKTCRNFVRKVAYGYHLPYFTITPTFSICPAHGYLRGEIQACPTCSAPCEIWSRIVGYFRPIDQWNKGKQSEYKARVEYQIDISESEQEIPKKEKIILSPCAL